MVACILPHLVQAALRKVLGDEVHQMGSDITAEQARDFPFAQIDRGGSQKRKDLVNGAVQRDLPMTYVVAD